MLSKDAEKVPVTRRRTAMGATRHPTCKAAAAALAPAPSPQTAAGSTAGRAPGGRSLRGTAQGSAGQDRGQGTGGWRLQLGVKSMTMSSACSLACVLRLGTRRLLRSIPNHCEHLHREPQQAQHRACAFALTDNSTLNHRRAMENPRCWGLIASHAHRLWRSSPRGTTAGTAQSLFHSVTNNTHQLWRSSPR